MTLRRIVLEVLSSDTGELSEGDLIRDARPVLKETKQFDPFDGVHYASDITRARAKQRVRQGIGKPRFLPSSRRQYFTIDS